MFINKSLLNRSLRNVYRRYNGTLFKGTHYDSSHTPFSPRKPPVAPVICVWKAEELALDVTPVTPRLTCWRSGPADFRAAGFSLSPCWCPASILTLGQKNWWDTLLIKNQELLLSRAWVGIIMNK